MEIDNDEAKLLTMLLVEDRSGLYATIRKDLAPHGQLILEGLRTKLAREVLDVDWNAMSPADLGEPI